MKYIEFVETIKSILKYEGDEINPQNISSDGRLRGTPRKGQYNLSKPLTMTERQGYIGFIGGLKDDASELPKNSFLTDNFKEGWYISDHEQFDGYPAIYYYNGDNEGDSVYVFNPFDLVKSLWFNGFSLKKVDETDDLSFVTYYVGLDILNNINTIKFINWPIRHPREVK